MDEFDEQERNYPATPLSAKLILFGLVLIISSVGVAVFQTVLPTLAP